uniref:Lipase maturation factor n=1 Tax=Knipowitschia caucasica TaxID=637954 RepID=A0AAV2KW97_KNICA
MDRASDLTDAFVEVKFGNTTFKTDVFPKSLNPQWNSEWFKFEVDDEDLQDEPLQITVLDHDTYSANDAIGKVYIDIDPLLATEAASIISGWFPIYDTIHGIRGEINVLVKVELFNDLNRFRQSSCGVKFFCTTSIPRCYRAVMVHGFVEELVVNEDPEYQWIDRIRTPRASNEARQRLISLMSGELQRKIGLKVLEMGGNAVVGYLQCFDLEGESGLVVRAIGTACTLDKLSSNTHSNTAPASNACNSPSKEAKEPVFGEELPTSSGPPTPFRALPTSSSSPPPFSPSKPCSRQSSSSDTDLSLTPKTEDHQPIRRRPGIFFCPSSPVLPTDTLLSLPGPGLVCSAHTSSPLPTTTHSDSALLRKSVSFNEDLLLMAASGMGSGGSAGKEAGPLKTLLRQQTQTALEQREFPFFTLTTFPPGFLVHVGGVVSARSVKLLDRIHNPDEPETRDAWWEEIRQEIKSHAKSLGCHAVVGYSESTSICEEVCILSASGTAAILNPRYMRDGCLDLGSTDHRFEEQSPPSCGFCHIPYDELNMPFPAQLTYCYHCRRQKVPDVLFTTIDLPPEAAVTGKGCLIQARLCRLKKKAQGEVNATAISNLLPFMEYELHTQLMNKLKLRCMNALFGLHIQISVGENMLLGLASATGVYLSALPAPGGIQIAGKTQGDLSNDHHILTIQKKINETIARNKELYQINPPKIFALDPEVFGGINMELTEEGVGSPIPEPRHRNRLFRSHSESSDEVSELDLSHGKKDAFVLEIDDTDAVEDIHALLIDAAPPTGFHSCNTEFMPGINNWTSAVQMFTSVRVLRLNNVNLTNQVLNKIFTDLCENLLKSFYFKLRSMIPCCLCRLNFTVAVPEEELIQVTVTAVAMTFDTDQTQDKPVEKGTNRVSGETEEQLQFPMELCADASSSATHTSKVSGVQESTISSRVSSLERSSPVPDGRSRSLRSTRSFGGTSVTVVKMTPLAFLPGTRIIKYLGIINMFFIRETTSLREEGGVSGFLHSFIAEVFAMVRAHVAALGGNAVVSYSMKECMLMENPNKNQAQCLINVSGDAVICVRDTEQEVPCVSTCTAPASSGGTEEATDHLWTRTAPETLSGLSVLARLASNMGGIVLPRRMFLWCMALIYLSAFVSLYVQIPGLYGNEGLLPARWRLRYSGSSLWEQMKSSPTLLWLGPHLGLDTHTCMELLCLLGAALSLAATLSEAFRDSLVFLLLWALYMSMYQVGQVFLYFQWDNLLLEAGFLCVLISPLTLLRGWGSYSGGPPPRDHDTVTFWLLRWLLFRLMFASGVVKLTSRCPTWWGLTALTYHYETQCIPTPAAWFAHQLPVWWQKLSVVGTLFIEIAVPLLFFSPLRRLRIAAFYLQILLQALIIISGNYNFFNWLTVALCLSLLDDEHVYFWMRKPYRSLHSESRLWAWLTYIVELAVWALLLFGAFICFDLQIDTQKKSISSRTAFTFHQFNLFLKEVTFPSVWVGVLSLTWEMISAMFRCACVRGFLRRLWGSLQWGLCGAAAVTMFSISLVPFTYIEYDSHANLWPVVTQAHGLVDRYQLVNSYGLFRRMTGVGGRPEVVIEGSHDAVTWVEIEFMYKPGNMSAPPPLVTPHQPRLDWQMWFAALGPQQQSPWFSSLMHRLLQGKQDVIELIQSDISQYPFHLQPPAYLRARRYKYWFTEPKADGSLPERWWRRVYDQEFYPTVHLGNAFLEGMLNQHGLKDSSPSRRASKARLARALRWVRSQVRGVAAPSLVWTLLGCSSLFCLLRALQSTRHKATADKREEKDEKNEKDEEDEGSIRSIEQRDTPDQSQEEEEEEADDDEKVVEEDEEDMGDEKIAR